MVEYENMVRSIGYSRDSRDVVGLFFVSYANTPRKFERQLERMIGNDGPKDRIMEFSTPIAGNYWYIPSVVEMSKL